MLIISQTQYTLPGYKKYMLAMYSNHTKAISTRRDKGITLLIITTLIESPPILIVLMQKSTPMVGIPAEVNTPSQ